MPGENGSSQQFISDQYRIYLDDQMVPPTANIYRSLTHDEKRENQLCSSRMYQHSQLHQQKDDAEKKKKIQEEKTEKKAETDSEVIHQVAVKKKTKDTQ